MIWGRLAVAGDGDWTRFGVIVTAGSFAGKGPKGFRLTFVTSRQEEFSVYQD
jgi:hypothetical protein